MTFVITEERETRDFIKSFLELLGREGMSKRWSCSWMPTSAFCPGDGLERTARILQQNFFPEPRVVVVDPEWEVIPIAYFAEVDRRAYLNWIAAGEDAKKVATKLRVRQRLHRRVSSAAREYDRMVKRAVGRFRMATKGRSPCLRWLRVYISDKDRLVVEHGFEA